VLLACSGFNNDVQASGSDGGAKPSQTVDIEALAFAEGGHYMSNKRCELPAKSWRAQKKVMYY
jgi:hypothetical protein